MLKESLEHLQMLLRRHVRTEPHWPSERRAEKQAAEVAMWVLPSAQAVLLRTDLTGTNTARQRLTMQVARLWRGPIRMKAHED